MEPPSADRLRSIPIFSGLGDEALARVASVVTEFEAPAGHVLIQAGQEGSGMFVLEEGEVAVEIPGHAPLSLGPGEFFGELSILGEGVVRTARVRAATAVRCVALARADFARILEAEPRIAVSMLPVLARRLADLETGR
jgi:CRP-like cAMP-binding protein